MSYQQVIDILTDAKNQISQVLTTKNDEHHRLKLESDLQRNITYISLLTNTQDTQQKIAPETGPATTIAGKPIVVNKKVKVEDLEPHQERLEVLRRKIENAYPRFLKMETQFIKNEFEENVIRGVAKKAKMKVTKEEPAEITLAFVEEIKENIRLMAQREKDMNELKASTVDVPLAGDVSPETVTNDFVSATATTEAPRKRGRPTKQ